MTKFGEYLARRSVNRAAIARKTGLSRSRLNELALTETAKLRADELFLIALAIKEDPAVMLMELYGHLTLQENS